MAAVSWASPCRRCWLCWADNKPRPLCAQDVVLFVITHEAMSESGLVNMYVSGRLESHGTASRNFKRTLANKNGELETASLLVCGVAIAKLSEPFPLWLMNAPNEAA